MTPAPTPLALDATALGASLGLESLAASFKHITTTLATMAETWSTTVVPGVAAALADGRTPEEFPAAGRGARSRRLLMTATTMARRGQMSPAMLEAIYTTYTAAIWADEDDDTATVTARAVLCTGPSAPIAAPHRPPRVLATSCTRPGRGLVAPAACNAPPARLCARPQSLTGWPAPM
jgi:hypothetical protein